MEYVKGFACAAEECDANLLAETVEAASRADKVVICAGLPEVYETEGMDREHLNIPGAQIQLIEEVAKHNKNIIVVLSNGAPVVMPFEPQVKAIVEGYLLGQAGAEALAKVLYGKTNPSGKLAETFPQRLEDTPCFLNFPGEGYHVEYREGIFVGYRYYDTCKVKPLFCFGHGLSYTDFSYEEITVDRESMTDQEKATGRVKVKNTGAVAGKEVVELDKRSFAYYDVEAKDFLVQSGRFEILVGASSEDIRLKAAIEVTSTAIVKKHFYRNSTFGEIYYYEPTREIAREMMDYFERESGIDFSLGDRPADFAFRVICDFPLKTLVTFTKGRFSEQQLTELLEKLNGVSHE